eukprot:2863173-Rhodomonas_salina.1
MAIDSKYGFQPGPGGFAMTRPRADARRHQRNKGQGLSLSIPRHLRGLGCRFPFSPRFRGFSSDTAVS